MPLRIRGTERKSDSGSQKRSFTYIDDGTDFDDARTLPAIKPLADKVKIISESSTTVYGLGYQDVPCRVPSIENARKKLGFNPTVTLQEGLERSWAVIS